MLGKSLMTSQSWLREKKKAFREILLQRLAASLFFRPMWRLVTPSISSSPFFYYFYFLLHSSYFRVDDDLPISFNKLISRGSVTDQAKITRGLQLTANHNDHIKETKKRNY